MIRFSCPKCEAVLEAPESKGGGVMTCPECRQKMQVPDAPARSAASARKGHHGADNEDVVDDVEEIDDEDVVDEDVESVEDEDAETAAAEDEAEGADEDVEEVNDDPDGEDESHTTKKGSRALSCKRAAARDDEDEDEETLADDEDEEDAEPSKKKSGGAFLLVALAFLGLLLVVGGGWAVYEFAIKKEDKVVSTTPASARTEKPPTDPPPGPGSSVGSGSSSGTPSVGSGASAGRGLQPNGSSGGSTTLVDDPLRPRPTSNGQVDTKKIFDRVMRSTVFIAGRPRKDIIVMGSGFLIDRKNRLVITNQHVVRPLVNGFIVSFPKYKDGPSGKPELITDKEQYLKLLDRGDMGCKVLATSQDRDLALIQLPEPLDKKLLALIPAETEPDPGSQVHSVGSPGASDAVFLYTPGSVRTIHKSQWQVLDPVTRGITSRDARVIETTSPTNHGDSGGPLVNNKAELVAVTEGGATQANSLSIFIALSEVKEFLKEKLPMQSPPIKWEVETEGKLGDEVLTPYTVEDVPGLELVLKERDTVRRARAAHALSVIGPAARAAIPQLLDVLKDTDPTVQHEAIEAINAIGAADELVLPDLIGKYLKDKDPRVRQYTARTIGAMGAAASSAVDALIELTKDTVTEVRKESLIALCKIGTGQREKVLAVVFGHLKDDPDPGTRKALVQTIALLGPSTAKDVNLLKDSLQSSNAELRLYCARSLGQIGPPAKDAVSALGQSLKHEDKATAAAAAEALGKIGHEAKPAAPSLIEAIQDGDSALSKAAADALLLTGKLSPTEATALVKGIKSPSADVRGNSLRVLKNSGADMKGVVIPLGEALKDSDKTVRVQAAEALGSTASSETRTAIPRLVEALKDNEPEVRLAAVRALGKYGSFAAEKGIGALDAIMREEKAKEKPNLDLLREIVLALGAMKPNSVAALDLVELLQNDATKSLAEPVAKALGMTGLPALEALFKMTTAKDPQMRKYAAKALIELDPDLKRLPAVVQQRQRQKIVQALTKLMMAEKDPEVQKLLDDARRRINGDL